MPFSTFNSIQSFLVNISVSINIVLDYIYNFPNITTDASLALYYPLDISNNLNLTPNYASGLPVYDASMNGSLNIINKNNYYVTSLGDLSLNNTMGSSTTNYVVSNQSFNLVPTSGLSISCWFSCSGQLNTIGTLVSLANITAGKIIELDICNTNILYSNFIRVIPSGYTYYFKFRGDAVNYGSLSSTVPNAISVGSSPNPNGTAGGKTCLRVPTGGDYVYFPAFGSLSTTPPPPNFSFGYWIYTVILNGNSTHSIGNRKFIGTNGSVIWMGFVGGPDSKLYHNIYSAGGFVSTTTNFANQWVHMFFTIETTTSKTIKYYRNGILIHTSTNANFIGLSDYYMILGRAGDSSSRIFTNSGMREFLFYNRTLSDAQVFDIYQLTNYA